MHSIRSGYALTLAMLVGLGTLAVCTDAMAEAPVNDLCADALVIGDGDTSFVTIDAETDGPAHPDSDCDNAGNDQVGQDIWYCYTATCTGPIEVSTCGTADFDTRIAIYDECSCPANEERLLACNDDTNPSGDCPGFTSIAVADVVEGDSYLIRIGGFDTRSGTGTVNITCGEAIGACCEDLVCTGDVFESACNGAWYEGETCDDFVCPEVTYCDTCWSESGDFDDIITNVTFAGIDNTTGEEGTPCQYVYYNDLTATVDPGGAYLLSVTVDPCYGGSCYTQHVWAWIDWNRNGEFEEAEAYDLGESVEEAPTVTTEIVVPADANSGITRLRVSERYNSDPIACDDGTYGSTEDYNVNVSGGIVDVALTGSTPAADQSLWRSERNYMTLDFDGDLPAIANGDVMIRELLADGAYGPDLSANFGIDPMGDTLIVVEITASLEHGKWYAVSGQDWNGVEDFLIHLVCLVGDANADNRVLPNDLSLINTAVPSFEEGPLSRFDINGDGRALPNDLSIANTRVPTVATPAKPSGH